MIRILLEQCHFSSEAFRGGRVLYQCVDRFYSEEDDLIEEEKAGSVQVARLPSNGCITNSTSSNLGEFGDEFFFSTSKIMNHHPPKCCLESLKKKKPHVLPCFILPMGLYGLLV